MYIAYQYRLYPTKKQREAIERRFTYARSIYRKLLAQAITTGRRRKWPEIADAEITEIDEYARRTSDEPKLKFHDQTLPPIESSLFYQNVRQYPLNKITGNNQKKLRLKTGAGDRAWLQSFNFQETLCLCPRNIYIGRIGLVKAKKVEATRKTRTDGAVGTNRISGTAGVAQGRPVNASVVKTCAGRYYVSLLVRYEPNRPEGPN